ncbi:hypothetical protein CLV33_102455 [Jejuia pallidilutea]|uniref:Periplasmic ATP/GTP-binding protein n=1 Tax=Jejuia pallidilutea TaxID=504487 RepID=A0A362X6E6_9FLAO|nr:gluconolaconase [Jejuia pallidilutea]PQV50591.1 hypothetical protein CLV33_102455 [Jejuia pallidilutea]
MFKSLLSLFVVLVIVTSCGKKKENSSTTSETATVTPTLELLWETDSLLTTCESVLYDKNTQTIYVANINDGPWVKDNNGFISTINTKGEITQLKWVEGLSAPKGMGLYDGKLYVNDIDDIVEIDIDKGIISNRYTIEDNPQLNDLTVDSDGIVYSSGSNSNKIHKLENGVITVAATNPEGKRLNGLLWQEEGIYYADFAKAVFGLVSHKDQTFKAYIEDLNDADGIIRLDNGDFIVSGWKGALFYVDAKTWTKTKLLDTTEQSIHAADIDYIAATQTLLVPTFFHNRVMAYKLKF